MLLFSFYREFLCFFHWLVSSDMWLNLHYSAVLSLFLFIVQDYLTLFDFALLMFIAIEKKKVGINKSA